MSELYAAQVEGGVVVQVIVGTADWANVNLSGVWVDVVMPVGVGWLWDGVQAVPPAVEVEGEEL